MRARAAVVVRVRSVLVLWAVLGATSAIAGCSNLHETRLATWEVTNPDANGYLRVPLASGQVIVTASDDPVDVAGGLSAEVFPEYLHAGFVVEAPDGWHVYEENASAAPWGAGPPTEALTGRVGRVPIDAFVRLHSHVAIFEPRGVDLDAVVASARTHL